MKNYFSLIEGIVKGFRENQSNYKSTENHIENEDKIAEPEKPLNYFEFIEELKSKRKDKKIQRFPIFTAGQFKVIIRKKPIQYKIVYDYMSYHNQYDKVILQTADKNEAIKCFLELYRKKQNGSLTLDSDCFVRLRTEISPYIRETIDLYSFKEDMDLNEILENIKKKLTESFETFKYTIKLDLGTGVISYSKYKILLETENRSDALKAFLCLFYQNQQVIATGGEIPDIAFEVSISPYHFDTRCLYLKYVKEEKEIIDRLAKIENDVIDHFLS